MAPWYGEDGSTNNEAAPKFRSTAGFSSFLHVIFQSSLSGVPKSWQAIVYSQIPHPPNPGHVFRSYFFSCGVFGHLPHDCGKCDSEKKKLLLGREAEQQRRENLSRKAP